MTNSMDGWDPRCNGIGDRSPILCGHPLTGVGRFPIWPAAQGPCHARDPPLLPTCIAMHRRSPAKRPQCREECVTAAKGVEGAVCVCPFYAAMTVHGVDERVGLL